MAQTTVTAKLKLAWWFPVLVGALAPLGWFGLRMPAGLARWIARKAARVETA